MGKNALETKLERSRLAIEGAMQQASIMKKLSMHGFGQKKMQEGKVLYEKLTMLSDVQTEGQEEQKKATAKFNQAKKEIDQLYRYHVNVAKIALQNERKYWEVLQLQGTRKRSIIGWLSQTKAFYKNIIRFTDQMAYRGVSKEELIQAREMLYAAAEVRTKKAIVSGEKQSATEQKRSAEKALDTWMSDFCYIAKYALRENKQLLESLGISAPSRKKASLA